MENYRYIMIYHDISTRNQRIHRFVWVVSTAPLEAPAPAPRCSRPRPRQIRDRAWPAAVLQVELDLDISLEIYKIDNMV